MLDDIFMQKACDSEATAQKKGFGGPASILLPPTQPAPARWPGGSSIVDLAQGKHPSGGDAPKRTGPRLGLSMRTHTSLNECSHSRASA